MNLYAQISCLIVIPVRNEPGLIQFLQELKLTLSLLEQGNNVKVLVIDDSNPRHFIFTRSFVKENTEWLRQIQGSGAGFGAASLLGLNLAKAEGFKSVLLVDGKGERSVSIIAKMIELSAYHDLVLPSRFNKSPRSKYKAPHFDQNVEKALAFLTRFLFPKVRSVSDPLNGSFLIKTNLLHLEDISFSSQVLLGVLISSDWIHFIEIPDSINSKIQTKRKALEKAWATLNQVFSLFLRLNKGSHHD